MNTKAPRGNKCPLKNNECNTMKHKKKLFWDLIIKFHERSNKKEIWNEIKNSHIFHSINSGEGEE